MACRQNYSMRIGVIQTLGALLCKLFAPDRQQQQQQHRASRPDEDDEPGVAAPLADPEESRSSMLAVLEARVFDVSPFVRSRVLQTWAMLAE